MKQLSTVATAFARTAVAGLLGITADRQKWRDSGWNWPRAATGAFEIGEGSDTPAI